MRLDPRAATLTLVLLGVALALSPPSLLAGWLIGFLGGLGSLGSLRRWWLKCRAFGWMIGLAVGIAILVGSIAEGLLLAAHLLLFAGLSALGASLIDPLALSEACVASGMRPQFAFLVEGTLRFVPLMRQTISATINAQRCRGIPLHGWRLLRHAPALVIPIVFQTLENANSLAETLEARGFSSPHWTALNAYRWRWADWFGCSCGLLILGIIWGIR